MASMTRGGKADAAMSSSSRRDNATRTSSYNGHRNNHVGVAANRDRGQNINHLMSFTLPPRLAPPSAHLPARRQRRAGAHSAPFNKERYVNAQYRFLVKPTGDYTAYFADSDIYLNWGDILTVLIPTSSALSAASSVNALSLSKQPALERHEGAACPICLSPPTAPRMTKCGHVFCYPCILHYLTVSEASAASGSSTPTAYQQHVPAAIRSSMLTSSANAAPKWKRCPICWDAVYAKDLKAVEWWDAKAHADEFEQMQDVSTSLQKRPDYLCMRLVERPHLTTLALPQSSTWPNANSSTSDQPLIAQHSAPWHFQPDVMTFSKFMLATPDQLLANLHANLSSLEEEKNHPQSSGTEDETSLYFVDMAEKKVQEQMEKVMNELDTANVQSRIGFARNELKEHAEIEKGIRERQQEAVSKRERKRRERERAAESGEGEKDEGGEVVSQFLQVQAQKQGGTVADTVSHHAETEKEEGDASAIRKEGRSSAGRARRNLNPPAPSSSSYLFFQASSGQNIFLHPLDIKVLLSIYGSYSNFPRTLQVLVEGADEGSMNEEIKKKCRYLAHLTKGTDIVFVEVDWDGLAKQSEVGNTDITIDREAIKMYEHALRQRKTRRRDRERKEDRAKARWEETEKASRPLPVRDERRSVDFSHFSVPSTGEDFFSSSLSSASTSSPSFRQAALAGAGQEFPIHPGTQSNQEGIRGSQTTSNTHSGSYSVSPLLPVSDSGPRTTPTTVWGTPAGRSGTFATALHNSSRSSGRSGAIDEDAPDWNAWLELEEDFIVGARNGTSVREGRGLNRQAKKSPGTSSAGTKPDEVPERGIDKAGNKQQQQQQKKKKLVLTSGGGGRGR